MRILDIPKSGRCGKFVYYMRGGRLCWRRYVVPRYVRTPARRRTRRSFGKISRAWSHVLAEEQRRAWLFAGTKVKSHPRLWQSGRLTGEMLFQAINSARAQIGRPMLLWPPARVVFAPNPVAGVTLSYVNGQPRLRLKVSGPLTEDIMVFAQAPCGPGRKKWRHGAYLGLLPAPQRGESDITEMYVARYGQPEPGMKVFIRTCQQKDGWEGPDQDLSALVPVKTRNPKAEVRRPSAEWLDGLSRSPGRLVLRGSPLQRPRIHCASPATAARCPMHKGVVPEQYRSASQATQGSGECGVRNAAWWRGRDAGGFGELRRKRRRHELWRGSQRRRLRWIRPRGSHRRPSRAQAPDAPFQRGCLTMAT